MNLVSNRLLLVSKEAILGKLPELASSSCRNNRFKAKFNELRNPPLVMLFVSDVVRVENVLLSICYDTVHRIVVSALHYIPGSISYCL